EVRLITLRSAIRERLVKISSCTPSVKKALSGSRLRFSKGKTAIVFSGKAAEVTGVATGDGGVLVFAEGGARRQTSSPPITSTASTTPAAATIHILLRLAL